MMERRGSALAALGVVALLASWAAGAADAQQPETAAPVVPAVLIEDFENISLGARPFLWNEQKASAMRGTMGVEKANIDDNDSNRGLQFAYQFPAAYAAGQAIETGPMGRLDHPQPLPGSITDITMTVYGDNSSNAVALRISDRQGEQFEWQRPFDSGKWSLVKFTLDPASAQPSGAGGNGKLDVPLKLEALRLVRTPNGQPRGEVVVDNITALCHFSKVVTLYDTTGGVKPEGWRAVPHRAVKGEVAETQLPRLGKDVPALKLEYEYEPNGDASVEFARTTPAGAGHGTLVAEVFGDGSNNVLRFRMLDGDGRVWQADSATVLVDWAGWKTLYLDTRTLRDAEGRDPTAVISKFPVSFHSLVVDDASASDRLPGVESGRKGEIYVGRLLFCSE
jgi:hypothetical protein